MGYSLSFHSVVKKWPIINFMPVENLKEHNNILIITSTVYF